MPTRPDAYARHFYRILRELDALASIAEIHIELPPDEPQWAAVRDRIDRATAGGGDPGDRLDEAI